MFVKCLTIICVLVQLSSSVRDESAPSCKPFDADSVSDSLTQFSFSLYKEVVRRVKSQSNVVVSPFSVSVVMAMALAGARGRTAEQLKRSLHLHSSSDGRTVACAIGRLARTSTVADHHHLLKSVSQVLVANRYHLDNGYKTMLSKYFGVAPVKVNFTHLETVDVINRRVEDLTNRKIKDLIPHGSFDDDTRMVLLNTAYYKGKWLKQFNPARSKRLPFYIASTGGPKPVTMMRTRGSFRLAQLDDADSRVLELPYEHRAMSMLILLPNRIDGLPMLESSLRSKGFLKALDRKLHRARVDVAIPKFKVDFSVADLNSVLKGLGVTDLFDDNTCDLSGVSGQRDLVVSKTMHRGVIEINEKGVEAAAATAFIVRLFRSFSPQQTVHSFKANRPFMFLIRENLSDVVHFLGRYASP